MEKEHFSFRRGASWSPGGLRKPLKIKEETQNSESDLNASWEKKEFNKEHIGQKTNLTSITSLSEQELKEARLKSQIIAAQLTIPSNSSSTSRGVRLFNRRKQRVNAFTIESCGRVLEVGGNENVKTGSSPEKPTWTEQGIEERDIDFNFKNTKPLFLSPVNLNSAGEIMDKPNKDIINISVIQEKNVLSVQDEQEEEDVKDEIQEVLKENIKHETYLGGNKTDSVQIADVERGMEKNGDHTAPVSSEMLPDGCQSTSTPEKISLPSSKQTTSIINRTARPFFSPLTVSSPEVVSPVLEIPLPPSYFTPPLPSSTVPHPVMSPPPPPLYTTPPLPAFTNQPPQTFYSSPPPVSPAMSPCSLPQYHFPVSQQPAISQCPSPTATKLSTFVLQSTGDRKVITPIKTGILEGSAARRASKKSMFTFKEKPVIAPNPELLSLVQGADERKKHGHRSVREPACEEELMALGAEASNFLVKEKDKAESARAPEWASCLKTSRTRPRVEHHPEQNLTNMLGKGAELFAKCQSRMEKHVIENQNVGQIRSPSPAMSLPPSWVYPSNMPGRVKAIAKNSDMSAQLSQNLMAQQAVKHKPKPKVAVPEQVPEPPTLENGCSKIEMDLSRHQPYQLNSALFILNPVKDSISTLPRTPPQAKIPYTTNAFSRQTSLASNSPSHFPSMSPQLPFSTTKTQEYPLNPTSGHPRFSSPASPLSPEQVSSHQSGVQAPKPTFSAKKAGITPEVSKDSPPGEITGVTPTPTSTPGLTRNSSSHEGSSSRIWTSSPQPSQTFTTISSSIKSNTSHHTSSVSKGKELFVTNQNDQFFTGISTFASKPSQRAMSPCSPPWGSRCQSPAVSQSTTTASVSFFRAPEISKNNSHLSFPWASRSYSPVVSQNNKNATGGSFFTSKPSLTSKKTSFSTLWGSRSQSPAVSQNTQFSTISTSKPSQTPPWGSKCQSPQVIQDTQSSTLSVSTSRPTQIRTPISPGCPPWSSHLQSPSLFQSSFSFQSTNPLQTSSTTSSSPQPKDRCCMSPDVNNLDSRANHRLLAKNIINAAKRKNSPSPGALSGHSLPISLMGNTYHDWQRPPINHFQSQPPGAQSPTFTSPPATPTQRICSPVRLYNTRSLTDSDASVESEDSGLRSPGLHSYHTCPRGWGSLRVKRSTIPTDL